MGRGGGIEACVVKTDAEAKVADRRHIRSGFSKSGICHRPVRVSVSKFRYLNIYF